MVIYIQKRRSAVGNWRKYNGIAKLLGPNALVEHALREHIGYAHIAVDLGAGSGRDSLRLRNHFRRVVAVDSGTEMINHLGNETNIDCRVMRIEDFLPPPGIDFCCAVNVLWFITHSARARVIANVWDAMRPDGIFAFNLMRERDEWVEQSKPSVFATGEAEVELLMRRWEVLYQKERFFIGPELESSRQKAWHLHDFILRKN